MRQMKTVSSVHDIFETDDALRFNEMKSIMNSIMMLVSGGNCCKPYAQIFLSIRIAR